MVGKRIKRKGICVYLELIHAVVHHKPIQHCKAIILQIKKKKSFTGEFHQTFKEKSTSTLLKLFQNTSEEGMFLNSFYEASITLIAKQGKDTTQKRKLQANIADEHRHKIL